jgi:hypothetical protein
MTLRAHTRIDLAYVPAPVLPEGHLGVTMPSIAPSGQVLQVDGGRVVVFSTATRVDDLRLERPWTLGDLDRELALATHELAPDTTQEFFDELVGGVQRGL